MARRRLTPDERALWQSVARTAEPLHPAAAEPAVPPQAAPAPKRPEPEPSPQMPPLTAFRIGARAEPAKPRHDLLPALTERLRHAAPAIDAGKHRAMTRGKLRPEGRIDLHGMTAAEAHPLLTGFILSSHQSGRRLVLVITGKGKLRDELAPMPVRQGVLRHQVPHWLSLPPLRGIVLQITPAHIRHGGEGAYYVYLRKRG